MKNIVKNKLINFFICLFLISFGFILGKIFDFWYFKIDDMVQISDLLSIAATLFAAYLITTVLDTRKQDKRIEKDLILKKTEDIYQMISKMCDKVINISITYQEASSFPKMVYTSIKVIFNAINSLKLDVDNDMLTPIKTSIRNVRELLTSTPIVNDPILKGSQNPIKVENGMITFSQNRVLEILSECEKLKQHIFRLQLEINRSNYCRNIFK